MNQVEFAIARLSKHASAESDFEMSGDVAILRDEIDDLTEQVRVRDEALRKIADSETDHFPCGICERCEENVAIAKAALDAVKEK